MKALLVFSAALEAATGLALILSPPLVARLLLGVSIDGAAALTVGRLAGAALLSLGLACWFARGDGASPAGRGLVAAMLLYNVGAVAVLAYAGAGLGLFSVLLWPAVVLHAILMALMIWALIFSMRDVLETTK